MKKILAGLLAMAAALTVLTGCTSYQAKSYTYRVETGDSIEVQIDTAGGYDLSAELPFQVKKGDEILMQGTFITRDVYDAYRNAVPQSDGAAVLDEGEKNGVKYLFYSYNDSEYDYVILISGSDTGVLMGTQVSEACARECFERLKFTKK